MPSTVIVGLTAPFIGSFIGVLVHRLPVQAPVLIDRSRCDTCAHVLLARDLVPLVSWLVMRGQCRHCGARIEFFYPAIELAALFVVLWAATATSGVIFVASCVLGWLLLALALTDWRTFLLPDGLVLALLISGLAFTYFNMPTQFVDHLLGTATAFAAFSCVAWVYRRLRRRAGLGLGDSKLLAGLGAWISWDGLPSAVLLAAVLGLLFVSGRSFLGVRMTLTDRLPFGTFLAIGGWAVWLYGPLVVG